MTRDQYIMVVVGMVIAWLIGLGAGAKIEQMNHEEDLLSRDLYVPPSGSMNPHAVVPDDYGIWMETEPISRSWWRMWLRRLAPGGMGG